jgi:tripartite-type tricarboxylate transporter receptor subunit TctC
MTLLKALYISTALVLTSGAVQAQQPYPSRTIEIVVPSGAGGGQDVMVRFIQPLLEKDLGVSIRVTNVNGGAHTKGIMYANSAPADGYVVHCESPSGLIADVFKKMPIKFNEAFVPVVRMQKDNGLLWTGTKGRFKTVQEMIDFAKKNPGKVTVTIASPGGVDDASVGHFADLAGIKFAVVPMDSGGERMAAIIAGHVDLMYEEASAVGDMMKAGDIAPLVVFTDERLNTPELKNVPSAGEIGLKGWDGMGTWRGFAVKKGTPQAVVDRLTVAFKHVYDAPEYQKWAKENALDLTPGWMDSAQFGKLWESNFKLYTQVFEKLGRIK